MEPLNNKLNLSENTSDSFLPTQNMYNEKTVSVKVLYASVGTVSLLLSFIAIFVLRRAKRIPKSAKFLATMLLVSDCLYISTRSVEMGAFVGNPFVLSAVQVAGSLAGFVSYTTIAVMAVERLFAMNSPMIYIRRCSLTTVRVASCAVSGIVVLAYLTMRYGVCYWKIGSAQVVFGTSDVCHYDTTFPPIVLTIVVVVAVASYLRIYIIVRRLKLEEKRRHALPSRNVFNEVKRFSQTSIVLLYIIVVLVTYLALTILILIWIVFKIDRNTLATVGFFIFMFNSFVDSLLYILWFAECQLELLKLFSFLGQTVQLKTERMRMKVFDIVPYVPGANVEQTITQHV